MSKVVYIGLGLCEFVGKFCDTCTVQYIHTYHFQDERATYVSALELLVR